MVGGMVITVIGDGARDRIYVNCQERRTAGEPQRRGRRDTCAIYVQRNADSEQIRPGDDVWWQGKWVMWTPADRHVVDKQIPRRSYSGVKPPVKHGTIQSYP